nr:hypothetical protein [uncultured Roseococcus sp.]
MRTATPEVMADIIRRAELAGATWSIPLFRAVGMGIVRLAMIPRGERLSLSVLDMVKNPQPLVVLVNGDGLDAVGPDGFPQARRLIQWAAFTILHGAGGKPKHYITAVEAALLYRRLLLIECRGDHLQAWVDLKQQLAPRTFSLILQTPPGAPPHMGEMRPAQPGSVLH